MRNAAEGRIAATALLIWAASAVALGGCRPGAASTRNSRGQDSYAASARAGYIYISINGEGTISEFARSANGSLSFLRTAKAGEANGPTGIAIEPSNRFLYAANEGDGRVRLFRIRRETGELVPAGNSNTATRSGDRPQQIAIAPRGGFLYVTAFGTRTNEKSSDGSIQEYAIDRGTGALTAIGVFRGAGVRQPFGIAIAPDGRFLCASDVAAGSLLAFAIEPSGKLRLNASIPSLGDKHGKPGLVAFDPSGNFLYTTDYSTGSVVVAKASADGKLDGIKTFRVGISTAGPFAILLKAIGPTLFVYTGNRGSDTVASLAVKPDTLDLIGESPTGLGDPVGLITDPPGRNLYVVNREAATIARFAIGRFSGATLIPAASMFAVPYPSASTHPLYIATTRWDAPTSSSRGQRTDSSGALR